MRRDLDYAASAAGSLQRGYLAPDIVEAIVEGQQPRSLTVKRLLQGIPSAWTRAVGSVHNRRSAVPLLPSIPEPARLSPFACFARVTPNPSLLEES